MSLLSSSPRSLLLAAARELIGARGEAAARIARRLVGRGAGGWTGRGLETMLARRTARLRAAGLAARLSAAELLAAKVVTAACGRCRSRSLAAPAAPGRLGSLVARRGPGRGVRRSRPARRGSGPAPPLADGGRAPRRARPDGDRRGERPRRRPPCSVEAMHSSSGPLREELAATVAAIECGSSRAHALRALGERSRGTTLAALAGALERARRHGSPLSRTLHEQASSLRADQRREVTERAARAAPKMQLAVALLLVPSVLLIVAAAIVANSGSLLPGF